MKVQSEYLSTFEAAAILGCSRDNVRVLVRGGRLPVAIETRAGRLLKRIDVERVAHERRKARSEERP